MACTFRSMGWKALVVTMLAIFSMRALGFTNSPATGGAHGLRYQSASPRGVVRGASRRRTAVCNANADSNSKPAASPTGAPPDREAKLAKYAELFSIPDMPGDVRRVNVNQISAGKKPWYEMRREKIRLYDKLFSMGTTSGEELREQVHAIASGKITSLSQVDGTPEGSVRVGFKPLREE